MREVPLTWSARVITASPPAARIAAAIATSSVATTTRPMSGLDRAAPDMDDHRLAVDVGERLARQAGRGHAGGDENDRAALDIDSEGGKKSQFARLYGLRSGAQSL